MKEDNKLVKVCKAAAMFVFVTIFVGWVVFCLIMLVLSGLGLMYSMCEWDISKFITFVNLKHVAVSALISLGIGAFISLLTLLTPPYEPMD